MPQLNQTNSGRAFTGLFDADEIVRGNETLSCGDDPPHDRQMRMPSPRPVTVESLARDPEIGSELARWDRFGAKELIQCHDSELGAIKATSQLPASPFPRSCPQDQFGYGPYMNWLDHYLNKTGMSGNALAISVSTTRQTINKLRTGKMKITREWAEKLSPSLGIQPENLLFGPELGRKVSVTSTVPVRGEAAAGRWIESEDFDEHSFPPVAAVVSVQYEAENQFAYRIVGNSMDQKRIFDGDFVVCVPYWGARATAQTGDVIIVEQKRGQLTERTCKELVVKEKGYELWPRSSNPRWKEPIIVPKMNDPHTLEGTTVEIVGLVIGLYVQF